MEEEQTTPTLRDTLKKLNDNLDKLVEEKKIKKFKLPWKAKVGKAKAKKNWIGILYIQHNKNLKFLKAPIVEGVIELDGIPHVATSEFTLMYKGKPFLIVPEWSIEPFSVSQHVKETTEGQKLSVGWRVIANYLEGTMIKPKRSFGIGLIIFLLLVVGGIAYYLFKGGGSTGAVVG